MSVKKEENFLPNMFLGRLKSVVEDKNFPYFFSKETVSKILITREEPKSNFMFVHPLFVMDNSGKVPITSRFFEIFRPIVYYISEKYRINELLRMKLNLYTNQAKAVEHTPHHDFTDRDQLDSSIAILNFTTCNGGTNIDGKVHRSKENEILFFNNNLKHFGITQTDTQTRIVLNIGWK